MIKFDFETYMSDKVKIDLEKKNKLIERLKTEDMAGFINNIISNDEMNLIKEHAKIVRNNADVLLIIGMIKSYKEEDYELPVVSDLTREIFKSKLD